MYLSKTPGIVKPIANNLVWNGKSTEKAVYLTFDDGPIPEITPWVVDTLKAFNAKGTFFMVGENVQKHPDVFQMVKNGGHSYGNHTYNHLEGWKTPLTTYARNTLKAAEFINSPLFRPPYGKMTRNQSYCLRSRFTVVMWDVLSGDFDQSISSERVLQNIKENVRGGSIIVMHDSLKAEKHLRSVLPKALAWLTKQGYKMERLPMMHWRPSKEDIPTREVHL